MGVLFDECAENGFATQVHLDRPFDIGTDARTQYTVPQLAALVREAAGWLAAAGAGRGDRVAIVKDNHWDYDLLACAAVRIGAVPAQLSAHLPGQALETLLTRLGPALLVTTAGVLERGHAEGIGLAATARRTLVLDAAVPGALSLDDVRGHTAPGPRGRHDDQPLVINHTSGTTGVPKLVVHSTRTIIGKLARFESVRLPRIGLRRSDSLANASAYSHGRTFCWTASALCMDPAEISIITSGDPHLADPLLRAHPPTVVEALPASFVHFQPLTERLDNPFRRVRLIISTYDAVHPPTVRAYLAASRHRSPLWMEGWGQTETGPLAFRFHTRRSVLRGARGASTRNLGRPVPVKTRLRVVDPATFRPLPRGQAGLMLARTAARGLGYVGESDRWSAKQHGAWWNTGDIGAINRDGSVELLDREVDSTPQLSCLRTEDALEVRLPQALECVVLAAPHRVPLPVVVTADGSLDRAVWKQAVRGLPPLREPVVLTWSQVPRTGTGKVRRRALLEQITGSTDTFGSGRWT
ncbi:acyl--CoA ligase [Streptomyces sp. SID10853]|uniref:class I adenylate-forming enzyme family protein n=1 Tax=Streptomyces sp. SID10853 TaxID=2706028 RepID=UPI0013C0C820|nr:class I adenylate-forming enzyme family protein [Streptomyces sp. SID10853]NDZ81079.1 acyl--CoA ligase [Streptomyces sp. SID10853]